MTVPLLTRAPWNPIDQPHAISPLNCSASSSQRCINSHVVRSKRWSFRTRLRGQALMIPRGNASLPVKSVAIRSVMKESQPLRMGTRAPDFSVMFICNHCPFVIHIRKELIALSQKYSAKGIAIVAISSNSGVTHPQVRPRKSGEQQLESGSLKRGGRRVQDGPTLMAAAAKTHKFPFLYLHDESQEVAKAYTAACTPDFYVFKKAGRRPFELAYHGQLDESRPNNGRPVTGRDLREALDCVISNRPVSFAQRPSIGCNIKWTPGQEPEYF